MKHIDHQLLERAYIEHRAQLVDYAATIVGDRSRGEDIVQEAYLRLGTLPDNHMIEAPFAFMRKIVRNLCIDLVRRNVLESRLSAPDTEIDHVPEAAPSLERSMIGRQDLSIILRAMQELPERTRLALEMHRFEGRKLSEIADRLGVSVAQAHNLVYQGLDHCRRRLGEGS